MASSNHPILLSPSHPNSGEHSPHQRDRSVSAARSIDIVPLPAEISISSKAPPNSADIGDNNGDKADSEDDDNSFVAPEDEEVPFHERPWYKRPSAWWILPVFGFVTCFMFMTVAAKTEIYIRLVCEAYKPEIASPLVIDNNSSSSTTEPVFIGRSTFVPFGDWGINSQYYDVKVPRPTSQCRADPEVGRRVAALATMITLTLGLFSVLTTGFWSKLSDSKGRTWVLKICVLGAVLSDINFIAVTLYSRQIPGSYNRFLWSSIVDGLAGGAVTSSAAAHAYISDCVHPTARSRMFSLYLGILYVGMAVSPALGGIAISRTGDLLTPFYAATAGHVAYFLTMFFLVPESLSKRQMVITAERRKAEAEASKERMMMTTTGNPHEHKGCSGSRARVMRVVKSTLFGFLEPLVVFAPQAVDRDRDREREEVGSGRKKDWNLTLIAGASAFVSSLVGASQFKFQYAAALFDWTSEEIGYWVTAVGVTRSVHLVVVLPLIIKIFGPKRADLRDQDIAPNDDRNDLDAHHSPSDATTSSRGTERTPLIHPSRPGVSSRFSHAHHHHHHHHNVAFDLRIAKGSLLVDMIAYFLTSLALESRTFSVATLLSSFGAGYAPAAQSLALSLMSGGGGGGSGGGGDAGKLFGAFAVINSLSSQIAGPAMYGATYILTVSWFPQGILWLSFLISFVAFLSFSFIRHPLAPPHGTYNKGVP
ncbi:major facilitator superfamily domain-containing protein [Cantharellus anzutake]|uniref:major facilitator superfamily domain-containing protein n=1 Tax=Cantharellus anzutake TaxID=1750568 RepID=UPI0019085A03|nr:major facilitator superfamily domain-containing protein [Cantharellus anzutake]KAF8344284.1 major facilitator superfamily domain-containing protein [Cantharellus anzutake]